MKIPVIRRLFSHRPFKALEICLSNGRKYVIGHPEAILITEEDVVIAPRGVRHSVWLDSDAITEIYPAGRNGRNGRK